MTLAAAPSSATGLTAVASLRGRRLQSRQQPRAALRPSRRSVVTSSAEHLPGTEPGKPSLAVTVDGVKMPNPFVIGSGPPGTNYTVMKKAFDEGWGGVICKTLTLDSSKVKNVTPRYAKLRSRSNHKEIIGWENIELVSDRPFETMLAELKQLKEEYPDRALIASVMEEYNRGAWQEIIGRCEEVGVDAFEINFSCPHGMPERRMGAAMGQDCELLQDVCSWINEDATKPVWAKMTPNITDITSPARVALECGLEGIAAINTIQSVLGVDLDTLRPFPTVEGYSTPGGYSSVAVKPIALAKCMSIAKMIKSDYPGRSLSGIGGVETGEDAAEFLLLGADTVQVCTGVMLHGYPLVKKMCAELQAFMEKHDFSTIDDFRGMSLPYFTTHTHLVDLQAKALEEKRLKRTIKKDDDWDGDKFVDQTETMVSN